METLFNTADPQVMFVDLNSCFATIEQQASPLTRGKPLVVATYATNFGCVLSPSVEAKRLGIKTGMRVKEARQICPSVLVKTADPEKYRVTHQKFMSIFLNYTPKVRDQSIDEAVLYFSCIRNIRKLSLIDIALEIKQRIKEEIGEWITCSIGISTNRFLAKTASSLHKPDGLDVITCKNLHEVFSRLELTDLCGINTRNKIRLNSQKIYTCLDFLQASQETLQKQVFKSIVGYYWYLRLRGFEIDDVDFKTKSYGQSYALSRKTASLESLEKILMKLCEKMGRRLRQGESVAYGIHVSCSYDDHSYWHKGQSALTPLFTTQDLFAGAKKILHEQPDLPARLDSAKRAGSPRFGEAGRQGKRVVSILAVSCFNLKPNTFSQLEFFESDFSRKLKLSEAVDKVNDRFGEYFLKSALMLNTDDIVVDRIAFGK